MRAVDLTNQQSGDNTYIRDGKDSSSNTLPQGNYVFQVNASDSKGVPIDVATTTKGTVTGITFDNNITYVVVNGQRFQLSDIKSINGGA